MTNYTSNHDLSALFSDGDVHRQGWALMFTTWPSSIVASLAHEKKTVQLLDTSLYKLRISLPIA